jgi:glycosyltransferase involved in cell wall biosynthesis
MRILYDGQIYAMQTAGGINRYFANIISRLPESYNPTLTAIHQSYKLNYPVHPMLEVYKYKRFRPNRLSSKIEKKYFRYLSGVKKFDIAHPTYYSLLTQKDIKEYSHPVVITVYDMIHELFAAEIEPEGYTIEAKRKAILAAQAIICISENTKKDLLKLYPMVEDKISVTYLASEMDASLSHGAELVPSRPYYLYVGSRTSSYKNFDGLLLAFSKAVSVNPEIALCVVGSSFNSAELNLIDELKLTEHIEHYGYASDSHIAKLYRCSVAFVYPSLYEGFGIPPLEAMACGTVVIASNSSSIPEVVGDAGILFEPKATGDLADILLSLLDNSQERDRLIAKGYQRAKMFSLDKTVSQTLDVYHSVA